MMQTSNLQLTPEQRAAITANPNQPLYIEDSETRETYLLVKAGKFPELEDDYIREGLEIARDQIARGDVSTASISELIAKAEQRQSSKS